MSNNQFDYLHEMGIEGWQLTHPERLQGYRAAPIEMPSTCRLLFVSPQAPEGELAIMFERVLKSMHLTLNDALYCPLSVFSQLSTISCDWVWFSGYDTALYTVPAKKVLQTPLLEHINGNNQQRRALWQQICSYDS